MTAVYANFCFTAFIEKHLAGSKCFSSESSGNCQKEF